MGRQFDSARGRFHTRGGRPSGGIVPKLNRFGTVRSAERAPDGIAQNRTGFVPWKAEWWNRTETKPFRYSEERGTRADAYTFRVGAIPSFVGSTHVWDRGIAQNRLKNLPFLSDRIIV